MRQFGNSRLDPEGRRRGGKNEHDPADLSNTLQSFRTDLTANHAGIRDDMGRRDTEAAQRENRILKFVAGMFAIAVTVLFAALKLLPPAG